MSSSSDQQYPSYGDPSYGEPSYGEPSHGEQAYREQAYGPETYGQQAHGEQPYGEPSYGHQEPDVAQTWQGQTWDTHYQPAAQPQEAAAPAPAPVSYPLPPEVPYDTPTTMLRPVTAAAAAAPAPAPAAVAPEPAYGAPTTLGNARMTEAQRARAEGRSPIIEPGIQPAALTALLGVLLAAGAALSPYGLLVPLVLLQAVTAAGWFRLNGMWPARQGIALAFAGGVSADIALLAAGEEHAPVAILGTLGVWVLLVLVLQLRSHAGADERQYGLMATVVSSALAVVAAGYLAAASDAVVVGALAAGAAVLVRALPLPGAVTLVGGLLAAAGAGAAAGGPLGAGALDGALLGLGAGVCALVGHRVASYDYPSRFVHMTAGVALPLALATPAVYLLGRVLV
ncbi:hypothetical protein AB0A69_08580 [Streptomyces sp. NPDC045431]|uniref:hypothetical protein n=1 Tax=Streptomyces sp. NPDC045431 TaxID=3155613 RepID=UPI003410188A